MENRKGGFRGNQGRNDRRGGFRGDRDQSESRGGFRGDMGPREMHKAVCADCGQECEVPFKPSGDRPVYCKECYRNHKKY